MEFVSIEQFLTVLAKSGLLSDAQLEDARALAPKAADARALAGALARKGVLNRWQAGQLLVGRSAFRLGKYRLIDRLGQGGMGSVFLGEHVTMNRRVALKVVPKGIERDPDAMQRFLSEARAIATLDHPNIVRAYAVDNDSGRYFLVMEYVEGRDLERIVKQQGPLDFAKAADSIRQAADGLAHIHGRGLLHRDIKPANLLVNPQGVIKILDLGLATGGAESDSTPGKSDEQVMGTVDYMAPEQAMGSENLDCRADIYSLGCTFYFLLTGQPPFPEGTLPQRIMKHQVQEPQPIAQLRPGTPRELLRICRKMMAKKPAERFPSAEEVSGALAAWDPGVREIKRAVPLDQTQEAQVAQATAVVPVEEEPLAALAAPAQAQPLRKPRPPAANVAQAGLKRLGNSARLMLLLTAGAALLLLIALVSLIPLLLRHSERAKPNAAAAPASAAPQSAAAPAGSADKSTAAEKKAAVAEPQKPAPKKPSAGPGQSKNSFAALEDELLKRDDNAAQPTPPAGRPAEAPKAAEETRPAAQPTANKPAADLPAKKPDSKPAHVAPKGAKLPKMDALLPAAGAGS